MFTLLSCIWCNFYHILCLHNCYLIVLMSTFTKKIYKTESYLNLCITVSTQIHRFWKRYFSKHPLSMHRNTWHCLHWMLTSCLLFSAVHCLHLPHFVCFIGQWALPSLSKLDFAFLFPDPRNVPINLLQSSIWKLGWVLVISLPLLIVNLWFGDSFIQM